MGQISGGQVKIEFDRNMLNETREDMIWEQNDNTMKKPPQRKTPTLRREQSVKTRGLHFSTAMFYKSS